ncbi:hypothetical protein B0H19DRAFT_1370246 [Mycena capillaripes]|nr:hypothetical protein B0H19DRAFT_1370246 [Mycena capillaripes]
MSTASEDPTALTRAQKRKITVADTEEKARQAQKVFEAEAKASGGRHAKVEANRNAVWNIDQPKSRKRTSSTVEVSDNAKKPRKSATVHSDAEEDIPAAQNKASSTKRKYAAPAIPIDSDSEPTAPAKLLHLDFTNLPLIAAKSKSAGKGKEKAGAPTTKSSKPTPTADTAKPKVFTKAKLPPAKIIADSASEVEASSDEGNDSDLGDFEDADEAEFLVEVPRVVPVKAAAVSAHESDSEQESEDMEITDSASGVGQLFDSDQESIEFDKGGIESDDDDKFPDAPPRRAVREDDDFALHEAIANGLVSIPMGHRSRRSSIDSWSSGLDVRVPDTDPDDEDEDDNGAMDVQIKKPRKISAARQKKADLEKPHVRAAPVAKPAHKVKLEEGVTFDGPPPRAEATWHPSAQIVYPAPGKKDILLNSQTEELQVVLRHGIGLVKTGLLFENAYPAIISRAGFARSYLISSAEAFPKAKHIRERLGLDLKYAAILADILLDRINILRGDIKRTCTSLASGVYQFAGLSAAQTKDLVERLLKDHRYIFPVDPRTQRLMTELPFMHPAMCAAIKDAVFTRNFKANNMHLFISTSKKHLKQLELPDAMVALVGTALYASLMEYRTTGERQTIAFTEGAYEDTYRNHMKTLVDTRDYAPNALHKVLHRLFNEVTDGKSTQPEAGSSSTLINLVEVDESD